MVAAVTDQADQRIRLVVLDADGQNPRVLADTEEGRSPLWLEAVIVYSTYTPTGPNEVRIVPASGGTSRVLYSTYGTIGRMQLVRPATSP